jgi:hypothetical protein
MVSAAGIAPAVVPSRTEHVAAILRAEDSERLNRNVGAEKRDAVNLGQRLRGEIESWRSRWEWASQALQVGCPKSCCSLREL